MSLYALGDISPKLPDDGSHYIAPGAHVMGNVKLMAQSSIWFGAVLRGDNDLITVGERSNVQDNSVLHTDPGCPLTIGSDVTIGHKVMLHGCIIGDNSLIGIGSTILNKTRIGKNCLVGAHTLITEGKDIPDGSMVMGSPGRVVKKLTDQQIAMLKMSAQIYVANAKRYRDDLRAV